MNNELRRIICSKVLDYLKLKTLEFQTDKSLFTCPYHKKHKDNQKLLSANLIPKSCYKVYCYECGFLGDIFSIVRGVEKDKKGLREDKIIEYLKTTLEIEDVNIFDIYSDYKWSLIPLTTNSKVPIEKSWTQNIHYNKKEWLGWVGSKYNIGLRTDKVSGIIAIDIDTKKIPFDINLEEIIYQETKKGYHLVYQYDEDLNILKGNKDLKKDLDIDVRADGNQIVIEPSIVDGFNYKWHNLGKEITKIPDEIKKKLLSYVEEDKKSTQNLPEINIDPIQANIMSSEINKMREGEGRNNFLISLGGQLRGKFSVEQTGKVLNSISQTFFEPPLPEKELQLILKNLYGYQQRDDLTIEQTIYEYIKQMQTDVTARDIVDSLNLKRGIVDKYLSKFVLENKLIRVGWGRYRYREIIEWQEKYPEKKKKIEIAIPYFNDVQDFYGGDMIVVGGQSAIGKTTMAMNIIKRLVDQGIKPYYLYSEAGGRFMNVADALGLKEGSYKFFHHSNPLGIELPLNGVTIIDWLLIGDKSMSDTIFKHLNEEMENKGGLLFIFMQLKEDNGWFAPNMVKQYPALTAKYIYDDEQGQKGHFDIDKIRDPKGNYKQRIIPCVYDFNTKILNIKEETEEQ